MGGTAAGSEHFAAYLRELKDRSGLSYGQLATRLHVGTSTLHRYCNGDAVPTDYAVVERLARLCGAGPEELVELHRRWVLADAARRAGNRGSGAGAARKDSADEERARAGDGIKNGDGNGEGNGDRGDAGAPAGNAGSGPPAPAAGPESVDDAAAAPDGVAELEPIGPFPGAPRPSRPWRRRMSRPAVAGSVAALVLTGAALAMTNGTGAGRPPAHAAASPSARPGSAGGTSPSPEGTGPGSPTPSASGSASPATPSATGTKGTPRSPGAGATASRSPVPSPPLALSVRSHVWQSGCSHRYLVNRPPEDVPPPPVSQDAQRWATALGAVHGGTTIVEATIRGRGSTPVVLQELHVRVADHRTPLRWSSYSMDNGCGGALTPAEYTVDLDVKRPVPHPRDGFDSVNTLPVPRLPYQVTEREPLVLRVHARTVRCDCDWYLELEWSAGGRTELMRIDDGGRPFRTSSVKGRPEYGYWSSDGWTRN
ncbi:helix-turn-helix domain-containing protein [Streptomyces sp. NPDC026673]|uniref:helix-turn-helix domain-containing protein n=1 Tax=Streptomyces sp. NPDC026673 TaxID=3155724 RepID=UPI0033CD0258